MAGNFSKHTNCVAYPPMFQNLQIVEVTFITTERRASRKMILGNLSRKCGLTIPTCIKNKNRLLFIPYAKISITSKANNKKTPKCSETT